MDARLPRMAGVGAVTMPALCAHHASVYRTRAAAIRHLPHGHKALAREARLIAGQCRECIEVAR